MPDTKVPSGFVVQVIQPGYMIADRVLRPALVGVSKGSPQDGAHTVRERGRSGRGPESRRKDERSESGSEERWVVSHRS